jgi:hypothetical protein
LFLPAKIHRKLVFTSKKTWETTRKWNDDLKRERWASHQDGIHFATESRDFV